MFKGESVLKQNLVQQYITGCDCLFKLCFGLYLFFRFNFVYFVMLLQGVGTLLPWNMFITAHSVSINSSRYSQF